MDKHPKRRATVTFKEDEQVNTDDDGQPGTKKSKNDVPVTHLEEEIKDREEKQPLAESAPENPPLVFEMPQPAFSGETITLSAIPCLFSPPMIETPIPRVTTAGLNFTIPPPARGTVHNQVVRMIQIA